MDDSKILPNPWASGSSDFWLSTLLGLLVTLSLSHIPAGVLAAVAAYSVLKYAGARRFGAVRESREAMVRLPVQAL